MSNWYISDPHFGHDRIVDLCSRPFASIHEMDETLIRNIASVVLPRDDLWILGDFGFGETAGQTGYLEAVFERLPGRKHLIIGNHDGRRVRSLPWETCQMIAEVKDGGLRLTLCHYPMITWHKARHGAMQLFGHVHNRWLGSRNSVNVGVDVWGYRPVQLEEITERAKTLPPNKHWPDVERTSLE
jgi:calcineurin-like phosphoesterase family protein